MTRKCPFVGGLSFGCGFVYYRCALTLLLYHCPPFLSHLSANYNFSVGNDSCRGQSACGYFGPVSIGDTSCNGLYACYNMYANVGDSSWYVYAISPEIMFEFYLIRVWPTYQFSRSFIVSKQWCKSLPRKHGIYRRLFLQRRLYLLQEFRCHGPRWMYCKCESHESCHHS